MKVRYELPNYYVVSDQFKKGKYVKRYLSQEKFLANNFALSDVEKDTSGPLNREGVADLPLLRTLLTIC